MQPNHYYLGHGLRRPVKSEFLCVYGYRKGQLVWSGTESEWALVSKLGAPAGAAVAAVEKSFDDTGYTAAMAAYLAEREVRGLRFGTDLAALHNLDADGDLHLSIYTGATRVADDQGLTGEDRLDFIAQVYNTIFLIVKSNEQRTS